MKTLLVAAALLGLLSPVAHSRPPLTYVATSTVAAPGGGSKVWAFQNTSSSLDVQILKIEISNAHDESAITGGLVQFQVFASTVVTHGGTGGTRTFSYSSANASAQSGISFSTGPTNVVYENVSSGNALALLRPFIINTDESATTNLYDSWNIGAVNTSLSLTESSPLLLPKGANRAIVIEQKNLGTGSIQTGKIKLDITYTVR